MRRLGPRNLRAASRWVVLLALSGALVSILLTLTAPRSDAAVELQLGFPAALLLIVALTVFGPARWAAAMCVLVPLAGVAVITGLDLVTSDASAAAQVFFCVPVLYAAAHLRPAGAVLVLAASLSGQAVVAVSLQDLGAGLMDVAYVGTTLVVMAFLLSHSTSENHRLVERLRRQASVDPLTGLVTRGILDDATRLALAAGALAGPAAPGAALVLVDLDHFKSVNDTHGHPVGDDALRHVGDLITERTREGDVVARMGGDEIGVLLPACAYETALERAEGFVTAVREAPLPLDAGGELALSISAGVAHTSSGSGMRELYASADAALYRAKRAGRGRVGEVPPPAAAPEVATT